MANIVLKKRAGAKTQILIADDGAGAQTPVPAPDLLAVGITLSYDFGTGVATFTSVINHVAGENTQGRLDVIGAVWEVNNQPFEGATGYSGNDFTHGMGNTFELGEIGDADLFAVQLIVETAAGSFTAQAFVAGSGNMGNNGFNERKLTACKCNLTYLNEGYWVAVAHTGTSEADNSVNPNAIQYDSAKVDTNLDGIFEFTIAPLGMAAVNFEADGQHAGRLHATDSGQPGADGFVFASFAIYFN